MNTSHGETGKFIMGGGRGLQKVFTFFVMWRWLGHVAVLSDILTCF